jgi:dTDP-4-dehydrorhamnose 3,5-epimerase
MQFRETQLAGVFEIRPEPITDERGFFARTWCRDEFAAHGLSAQLVQCSVSFNTKKGTLRGMHYQVAPFAETKLVRCTQGAIFDVVVDLRPSSPSFKLWTSFHLTPENRYMAYVPEGCAHGFITLADRTEVFYQMSQVFNAASARGFRWNDPTFSISWPEKPAVISERDLTYPDFQLP